MPLLCLDAHDLTALQQPLGVQHACFLMAVEMGASQQLAIQALHILLFELPEKSNSGIQNRYFSWV